MKTRRILMLLCAVALLMPVSGMAQDDGGGKKKKKPVKTEQTQRGLTPAQMLDKGRTAEQQSDYAEAVKWYRKAAEQGLAEAQYLLGHCHESGWGTIESRKDAIYWYNKATEQGHSQAKRALVRLFDLYTNVITPEDLSILRKLAEQEIPAAQCSLGQLYHFGQVVEHDEQKSLFWLRKAAEQGNYEANRVIRTGFQEFPTMIVCCIYFTENSSNLHQSEVNLKIIDLAKTIKAWYPDAKVCVSGWVASGSDNYRIATKRAESVKNHLIRQGVDPSRIETMVSSDGRFGGPPLNHGNYNFVTIQVY